MNVQPVRDCPFMQDRANAQSSCAGLFIGEHFRELCVWCSGVLHVAAFGSAVLLDYRYAVLSSLPVGSHLGFEYPGVWVHVDMAYPVYSVSCRHWRASVPRTLCSAVVTGVCMYVYIYMYVCVCVCVCARAHLCV